MTQGTTATWAGVTMPREASDAIVEAFRDEMAHKFGLHVTPTEARAVWAKLVAAQLKETQR